MCVHGLMDEQERPNITKSIRRECRVLAERITRVNLDQLQHPNSSDAVDTVKTRFSGSVFDEEFLPAG